MKRFFAALIMFGFGVIGYFYFQVYVQERNLAKVVNERLSEIQTLSLLGPPKSVIERVHDIPECGSDAKTIRYLLPKSVLIFKFEDGIGVTFKVDGTQCSVNRSSI